MRLEVQNLVKNFAEKQVLKDVSWTAQSGKAFGLLGRNGAGKTTSIRILMNVFYPDSGQILLDGNPIDYEKTKIGYLPEERGLYPKKKIIEQLVYFAQLKGMSRAKAVEATDWWLERVGLKDYRNKRLSTLSKGNQQKIQLITALAHDPQIIVLDEPFSGLDPVNAQLLKQIVKEEIQKGKIVFFSSHQMSYIEEFCDSIAILHQGKVALTGDLKEIKRAYPRNRLVVHSTQNQKIAQEINLPCELNEEESLLLTLEQEEQKTQVIQHLVANYDIDGINVFEPSLNDIFIQYTTI